MPTHHCSPLARPPLAHELSRGSSIDETRCQPARRRMKGMEPACSRSMRGAAAAAAAAAAVAASLGLRAAIEIEHAVQKWFRDTRPRGDPDETPQNFCRCSGSARAGSCLGSNANQANGLLLRSAAKVCRVGREQCMRKHASTNLGKPQSVLRPMSARLTPRRLMAINSRQNRSRQARPLVSCDRPSRQHRLDPRVLNSSPGCSQKLMEGGWWPASVNRGARPASLDDNSLSLDSRLVRDAAASRPCTSI